VPEAVVTESCVSIGPVASAFGVTRAFTS
jgi:hypothetical protein